MSLYQSAWDEVVKRLCFHSILTVLLIFFLMPMPAFAAGEEEADRSGWLYSKHLSMYIYLLRGDGIDASTRSTLQEQFHQFAFEFWLTSQTNRSSAMFCRRSYIRDILRGEGKNQNNFKDPASLKPFFRNGKLFGATGSLQGLRLDGFAPRKFSPHAGRSFGRLHRRINTMCLFAIEQNADAFRLGARELRISGHADSFECEEFHSFEMASSRFSTN